MSQRTENPRLTETFDRALTFAMAKHRTQVRKGGEIPYIGHLLSVAGLVIEADGTEIQAIAALLHDSVEDAEDGDGKAVLREIRKEFGDGVAKIVDECSDADVHPKPDWDERKRMYIEHLRGEASDETVLVSLADKLDNARAILRDLRKHGDGLWDRFTTKDPGKQLRYYESLLNVFTERRPGCSMVEELQRVIDAWKDLAGPSPAS